MHHITCTTRSTRRPRRLRGGALLAALAIVFVAGCGSSSKDSSSTTNSSTKSDSTVAGDVLGTPKAASGTPVKVGFISDGRTPSIDNSAMAPAAKATVEYINDYMGGIGGRPIDLVTCETAGDPGKATDCANQLVQENVVMTLMPENQQPLAVHTVMAANNIPLFVYAVTDTAITQDAQSSFMLASLGAGLSAMPIDVAKQNGIDKVTVLIVDVPAATGFYEGVGKQPFDDAGINLQLIKVPLGTADITQQINQIVTGGPTVVQVVGDPSLCIAGINGLRTNGFTGPITTLNNCVTDNIRTAVGSNMEGVIMASITPVGDNSNTGIQLWNAILAQYDPSYKDPNEGLTSFITTISARQALEAISGEITADTVKATIKAAPELPLVTGAGLNFRCNGKAVPTTPAICTRGTLRATLDANGKPILPYQAVGNSSIPG
jgi:branched-chain amino acid transport system substrate-binding protein